MPASSRLLLPLLGLCFAVVPARAQREGDGPPAQDPFGKKVAPVPTRAIGRYQSHVLFDNILTIRSTDGATLRVRPWREGVVRVEYFPAGRPVRPDSSLSVVQAPLPPEPDAARAVQRLIGAPNLGLLRDEPGALVWAQPESFGNTYATVVIQKNPLRVSYRSGHETVVAEAGGAFQQLSPEGGTGVSFRLAPDEHLYGTGSRALPLDRRGRRLTLYNEAHYSYQNGEPTLNVTLPTVVSSRGYMLFFDHHTAGTLDLGATDKNVLEYRGEGLQNLGYYLIAGDSYAEILSRYTALTGRQPLPPRWGLGLIQSRFGYKSEQEMYRVAGRMRRAGFPLDALVLGQGLVGRDKNGQPYTVESFWAGPATLLDMYRPAARQWLWQQYDRLRQDGVQGWWCDLGEPENQPADMVYDAGPTRRIHNGYGQAWSSVLSEGYQRQYPQERLFNLARSGWAGMQRHSVFPWSGDVNRSWSGYQAQVPIMLSMGLGGVGYMHSDAGGFCVGPVDPELYTRWLQMAALGPVLRPHGEGVPPEPYWYPPRYQDAVRRYAHLRYELLPYLYSLAWENSQTGAPLTRPMHYGQAEPYLGSLDYAAAQTRADRIRAEEQAVINQLEEKKTPLMADEPDGWTQLPQRQHPTQRLWSGATAALSNVNDQFFLGPNLLVAPVLQPGQRRRNVVLPAGPWIDFRSHETLPGGRVVGRPAPLAHLPLLVRAGAILPMTAYAPSTAQYRTDTLRVRYYADATVPLSRFVQYEDDGRTTQTYAVDGAYQTLHYQGQMTAAGTVFSVDVDGPGYPGAPARRTVELLIPRVAAAPAAAQLDGRNLPAAAWRYDAAQRTLRLYFPLAQSRVTVFIPALRLDAAPSRHADPEALTLAGPSERTFRGGTELRYTRHQPGAAGPLRIVDSRGTVVRTLRTATAAGAHTLAWDATDAQGRPVPGGVYWAELAGQRQRLVVLP